MIMINVITIKKKKAVTSFDNLMKGRGLICACLVQI